MKLINTKLDFRNIFHFFPHCVVISTDWHSFIEARKKSSSSNMEIISEVIPFLMILVIFIGLIKQTIADGEYQ